MPDIVNIFPAQCRLDFASTTALILTRYNGAFIPLYVGGVLQAKQIPYAGVQLSNAGVANSTRYYIYAYDNAGSLALEYSTTSYVKDATYGFPVKGSDLNRTLVGIAVTTSGGLWQAQGLGTISWYNRNRQVARISNATYTSHNSASYVEVDTALRVHFVAWADDIPQVWCNTTGGANSGADQWLALYLDGTTFLCEEYEGTAGTVFGRTGLVTSLKGQTFAEADHYVTLMQKESTTQFIGGNQLANKMNTVIEVCVMG